LSEDNDYNQAKQELAFIDGKIKELEEVINKAALINEGHNNCQEIKVGCRVTVQEKKSKHTFHLVGEWEADPTQKRISHQSPLGQALLGKKVGDRVEVDVPAGRLTYMIKQID
jgi:transcription elongation factor GreA